MNYNGRIFRGRTNTDNGEVSGETRFHYFQEGDRLWGTYSGGSIVDGHLLGTVFPDDHLEFCYHHLNEDGELMAGKCHSVPSYDANGTLVMKENWQWFSGDQSSGESEVEEVEAS